MENYQSPNKSVRSFAQKTAAAVLSGLILWCFFQVFQPANRIWAIMAGLAWALIFLPLLIKTGLRALTTGWVGEPVISISKNELMPGEQFPIRVLPAFCNR